MPKMDNNRIGRNICSRDFIGDRTEGDIIASGVTADQLQGWGVIPRL